MVDIVRVSKKFDYFSDMFACLISSTQGNIFAGRSGLYYQFFGVCSPVEEGAVKVQGVGACALSGVGLAGEVNVGEARESEGLSGMDIWLFFFGFINMFDPIVGVEVFNVIGGDCVSGFPSSLWRGITRHEE